MSETQVHQVDRRGIGDNSDAKAPLAEEIVADLAEEKRRADELLLAVAEASITNATDAGKVADLILMLRILERAIEAKRDKKKQPYQLDMRIVDATFAALITPLTRARTGPGSLTERLKAWTDGHPDEVPITSMAALGARRQPNVWIDDLAATVQWLALHHYEAMLQAARSIIGPLVRQSGVDAAEALDIPGVRVEVKTKQTVR
jgi:hypothetical protein